MMKRLLKRFLCIVICLSMSFVLLCPSAETFSNKAITDSSTMDDYSDALINDENGSRYAGRIWADKSVSTGDINLDIETDGYEGTITNNSTFLHSFSILGSSQAKIGLPPSRTVIVIDNSGSMYGNNTTDFSKTRIYKSIMAVNKAIDELMRAGIYNEISVILFGNGANGTVEKEANTAKVIIPMGSYPVSADKNHPYNYLDCGWAQSSEINGYFPPTPIKNPTVENVSTGGGFVYIDKAYINSEFKVNENLLGKSGSERYDVVKNGNTNIQAGIYKGFDVLLQGKKKIQIEGYTFGYIPNLVVLTDGAATDMLQGVWSNPVVDGYMMNRGFTNDRGNKNASYTNVWFDEVANSTYDWNMYIEIKNKNGKEVYEQVGYGDGTLTSGTLKDGTIREDANPGKVGRQTLIGMANDIRSTQGTMVLSTLLTAAYMKAAVKNEYEQDCKVYTISVDMTNPEDIVLPSTIESGSASYNVTSNPVTVNPNEYFNKEWYQKIGYLKKTADLNNLKDDDTIYQAYTPGSQLILGICDAIDAYNEFKYNNTSFTARNKLSTYLAYQEIKGLWTDMKDGSVTSNEKEYPATIPIGPDHGNAYFINKKWEDIQYPNLKKNDSLTNPYNITLDEIDVKYVTKAYYSKTNDSIESIEKAFVEIVDSIKEPAFVPVQGINAVSDNNLLYFDPIGKYMEIKDVKSILLFGILYDITEDGTKKYYKQSENGNDIEYNKEVPAYDYTRQYYKIVPKTTDELDNPCYGVLSENDSTIPRIKFKLSDIKIYIEENNSSKDDTDYFYTFVCDLPINAIPLQVSTIELDTRGKINYYTNVDKKTESTPLRIFYEVGIDNDILLNDDEVDIEKIDKKYIEENYKNGEIKFYSNYFSNSVYTDYVADSQNYESRGDAFVSFSPSANNRYYVFEKNLTIYSHGYKVLSDGSLSLIDNSKYFEGLNYAGCYEGETKNKVPTGDAVNQIKKDLSSGKIKEGDTITLSGDVIKYGTNPSSNKYYYFPIDYYTSTASGKGKVVQHLVTRLGSEFGSGILGDLVAKGEYVNWYDASGRYKKVYNYNEKIPDGEQDGNWILTTKIGGLRVGDLHQNIIEKENNITSTSSNNQISIVAHSSGTGAKDTILCTYLGNNGVVKYKINIFELPDAGGSGTKNIIIVAFTLILFSIVVFFLTLKRKIK